MLGLKDQQFETALPTIKNRGGNCRKKRQLRKKMPPVEEFQIRDSQTKGMAEKPTSLGLRAKKAPKKESIPRPPANFKNFFAGCCVL